MIAAFVQKLDYPCCTWSIQNILIKFIGKLYEIGNNVVNIKIGVFHHPGNVGPAEVRNFTDESTRMAGSTGAV